MDIRDRSSIDVGLPLCFISPAGYASPMQRFSFSWDIFLTQAETEKNRSAAEDSKDPRKLEEVVQSRTETIES